jgi:threonylcarbamoyladenosine tRNA methylthiotransferase MtaB
MSGANFETFGCKLNAYDTENIKTFCDNAHVTDTIVINTCAVTAEAVRKAKQSIRRSFREAPHKKIIVTGCAAQTEPKTFAEMEEVALVIGNSEKLMPSTWKDLAKSKPGMRPAQKIKVTNIMESKPLEPLPINGIGTRARAYVQIQNGCDHRCTFCIIPYGRGNSRSVSSDTIIKQIRKLLENGFQEIVLTGVDLTSWGNDLAATPRLGWLINQILKTIPDLPRLRISSIDSIEVDRQLVETILNEKRFMPHLHLSLQSGDNLILKRMKRRHNRENAIQFCKTIQLARPELVFGADIIVGFPTETDEMFKNSLDLINDCNLTWLHVFPFSARQGTPAAKMPQVNGEDIKNRAQQLRTLGRSRIKKYLDSCVGKTHKVLVEGNGKGRTETFAEVLIASDSLPGSIKNIFIEGHNGVQLCEEVK